MSKTVCVEGLSPLMREASLCKLFSRYGTVTAIRISVDGDGQCFGIAEVDIADSREATLLVKGLPREAPIMTVGAGRKFGGKPARHLRQARG
jgi:hypothetical protein